MQAMPAAHSYPSRGDPGNTAEDDGIESYALAHASLFAALTSLVTSHGSEAVALLVEGLPERIRAGEYDLERVIQ